MDLTTLPDEMLTNILNRTKYGVVRQLRRLNQKIDAVARRAELTIKVPVERLTLRIDKVEITFPDYIMEELNVAKSTEYRVQDRENYAKHMEKWLSRVMIFKTLEIVGKIDFGDEMLAVMETYAKSIRHITSLTLIGVDYSLSAQSTMKLFWKLCPDINMLKIAIADGVCVETIFNEQVLGGRKWKLLDSSCHNTSLELNDSFMINVIPNCERFFLRTPATSFTLQGAVLALKKCFKDDDDVQIIDLGPLQLGDIPFGVTVITYFELFIDLPDLAIQETRLTEETRYMITVNRNPQQYLQFHVKDIDDNNI